MSEFAQIPLGDIRPSKTNPRRNFDKDRMRELTESVAKHGVLQPVLVRRVEVNGKPSPVAFELVAGERRLRAAEAAGLPAIPAIVRELTDQEALEIQVIENLQRDDLHPLEEADGYRALASIKGYDVAKIAERIGRSPKYVYDRLKLSALVTSVRQIFLDGKITAGHAILLARLKPADQERAMDREGGGVFTHEYFLWDPTKEEEDGPDLEQAVKARSVRELQGWIDQHVKFDLDSPDLPDLFPDTATSVTAAKEEAEKIVPITYESYVQADARDGQRVLGPRSWKRAAGTGKKDGPCDRAVTGVVVVGPGRGQAFKICTDKKGCKQHWGAEQREAKKRATSVIQSGKTGRDSYDVQERKRKEAVARRDAVRKRWSQALPAILAAIATAVKKLTATSGGPLAGLLLPGTDRYSREAKFNPADFVPLGKTAEDLVRHAAFIRLAEEAREWGAFEDFPKRAKEFGVDVKKIVNEVAPAVQTSATKPVKAAKTKKAKPAAGPALAAGGAGTCRRCGCTDEAACEGGCSWVEPDLCSGCAPAKARKQANAKRRAATAKTKQTAGRKAS